MISLTLTGLPKSVLDQSVALAIIPKVTEGTVMIKAIRPPPKDSKTALLEVVEDKTRW